MARFMAGFLTSPLLVSLFLVVLLASPVLQPLVAETSMAGGGGVEVIARALVILFDPFRSMGPERSFWVNTTLDSLGCPFSLAFNTTIVYAPSWALSELEEWMEKHYEDLGVPAWAEDYASSHNLTVRWLRLRPFYDYLWSLARNISAREGLGADDIVVVIGNIDNISRQYYEEPLPYIHVDRLEGVKGWAGQHPMAFYDLTVVPKPWPLPTIPFYGTGVAVNTATEPPIWSIDREKLPGYVEGLVRDHLRYHYLSILCGEQHYIERLHVHIRVVDYGNTTATETVLSMLNTSLVEELLRAMDPWTNYTVTLEVVNGSQDSLLSEIPAEARQLPSGWMVMDISSVLGKLEKYNSLHLLPQECSPVILEKTPVLRSCSYPVYILVTPRPGFFQFPGSSFNFTGIYAGGLLVLSFPGYGNRLLHGGVARAIVHEIGHFKGLGHPFQLELGRQNGSTETRWLMDYILSPMSYYDPALAAYRPGDQFYYDMARRGILLFLTYYHEAGPEARIVLRGSPAVLAKAVVELLRAQARSLPEKSTANTTTSIPDILSSVTWITGNTTTPAPVAVTVTPTVTATVTLTKTKLVNKTVTTTKTIRETTTETLPPTTVTVTETFSATKTVTLTSTFVLRAAGPPTSTWLAAIAAALIVGIALGYLLGAARKE